MGGEIARMDGRLVENGEDHAASAAQVAGAARRWLCSVK
jgi:hypothetical protein